MNAPMRSTTVVNTKHTNAHHTTDNRNIYGIYFCTFIVASHFMYFIMIPSVLGVWVIKDIYSFRRDFAITTENQPYTKEFTHKQCTTMPYAVRRTSNIIIIIIIGRKSSTNNISVRKKIRTKAFSI